MTLPATIAAAAEAIESRQMSPVELVDHHLRRIEDLETDLGCFITICGDEAREQARRAEEEIAAGRRIGPLHGIPLGLKDAIDTAGIRTTYGSRAFAEHVPIADAAVVARLRAAGAVILGKHDCHEFCFGGPAFDGVVPPARNPRDPARYAGGSSSGSAVSVAAGQCLGAVGTDTGGSIRVPAAINGIVGHRPRPGLVPGKGVWPLAPSFDTPGPMATTVEDCALLLDGIAAADRSFVPGVGDLRGTRIGVAFADAGMDAGVRRVLSEAADALAGLGAVVEEVRLPPIEDYTAVLIPLIAHEAYRHMGRLLEDESHRLTSVTRGRIGLGAFVTDEMAAAARRAQIHLTRVTGDAIAGFDAVVCPGQLTPPPLLTELDPLAIFGGAVVTAPFSLVGLAALAVPAGSGGDGHPLGIQIASVDDATCFRIGMAFESEHDAHRHRHDQEVPDDGGDSARRG